MDATPSGRHGNRTPVTHSPPNAETHRAALAAPLTELDDFYIRSNFPVPDVDPEEWRLTVRDLTGLEVTLSLSELQALGTTCLRTTLECAGNGRTLLDPPVDGTAWTLGGTSTAEFTGVSLKRLFDHLGVSAEAAQECLFSAADQGDKPDWGRIFFERSLPIEDALRDPNGPLLVWAMNGEPLRANHGAPLRLVVPGWYAVASVKWLTAISLLAEPFSGYFQTDQYVYRNAGQPIQPVQRMKCRALILAPDPESAARLEAGEQTISGIAWSGTSAITGVTVSTDGGATWSDAEISPAADRLTPVRWQFPWIATGGDHVLIARAHDDEGSQPLEQVWNELGYGNNVVQRCPVRIEV